MKNNVSLIFIFILSFLSYNSFAQSHYIVVIDRINNTQTYKQKSFKNGRTVETDIKKPDIKPADLITVRMINFNELIYGLDVDDHTLVKKPESIISNVISSSTSLMAMNFSANPAMGVMTDLVRSVPSVSRGEETESSVVSIQRRLIDYLGKIVDVENDINSFYFDEGLTLGEQKEIISTVDKKYKSSAILTTYNKIKTDAEKVVDSSNSKWADINEVLSDYNEEYVNELDGKIKNIKQALREVDFISERTFPVSDGQSQNDNFEKLNLRIKVYKRAAPLISKEDAMNANKKYNFNVGENDGDQLNEYINITLKVKNKYKPFFSIALNRISVPQNRYSYALDNYSDYDSIRFKSSAVGGAKNSVGLSLNFDIPIHSPKLSLAGNVGYSMAFWKSPIGNDGENSIKKGFITSGISIGLKKFQYLSLSAGCAWGEYAQLSSKYQADKFILNDLSDAEIAAAVTKKIKPAFYFGVSMPVW